MEIRAKQCDALPPTYRLSGPDKLLILGDIAVALARGPRLVLVGAVEGVGEEREPGKAGEAENDRVRQDLQVSGARAAGRLA